MIQSLDNASDLLDLVEKDNLVKKDEIKKGKQIIKIKLGGKYGKKKRNRRSD